MTALDIDQVLSWRGRNVVDRSGEKIGKFEDIYLDTETDRPEWGAVATGLFGRRQSLVPLSEAQSAGDDVKVPFDKEQVESAPNVDPDGELSQDEEARLYAHYGVDYSKRESETGLPGGGADQAGATAGTGAPGEGEPAPRGVAPDRTAAAGAGEHTQAARPPGGGEHEGGRGAAAAGEALAAETDAGAMQGAGDAGGRAGTTQPGSGETGPGTSGPAEQVVEDVGTEVGPRERVRLKKYLITEEVTKRVPVTREEVRVEREPVEEPEDRR